MNDLHRRFGRGRAARQPRSFAWLALLAAAGCGAPRQDISPVREVRGPRPPPAAAAPVFEVAAVAGPKQIDVDGELDEWGATFGGDMGTTSRVEVALTSTGLLVAAHLHGTAPDGFWLGVASAPSEQPDVGSLAEVGGSDPDTVFAVLEPGCKIPRRADVPEDAPPESPECLASRSAAEAAQRAHAKRFQRWFHVRPAEVHLLEQDGSPKPVAASRSVVRPQGETTRAEASIPLSALPRFAEAPVTSLWLAVVAARSDAVPALPDLYAESQARDLPAPVAFEPLASIRAQAFDIAPGLSYHPADPLDVEVMRYPSYTDRSSFRTTVEPLYRKQTLIGDTEIGYVTLAQAPDFLGRATLDQFGLAVVTKDEATVIQHHGAPVVLAPHDGAVHALSFGAEDRRIHDGGPDSVFVPAKRAWLSCLVITPDGKHRSLGFDGDLPHGWVEVEAVHDAGSIGYRGTPRIWAEEYKVFPPNGLKKNERVEFRWRWDAKQRAYRLAKPARVKK